MAYPALYTRLVNFLRDANNGLPSPAPAKLDTELNGIQLSLAQQNAVLRGITTVDGRLRNVAAALAASLAGTSSVTSDGTTALVTTIPWVASPAFSTNTVLVMQGSTLLRPAQLTSVQDNGLGFLRVNLAVAPALNTLMVVWAFEPGAGILTRLASTTPGDGASLIGVEDAGGVIAAGNVEDALAENAGNLAALLIALGDLTQYFKANGDVVATDHFDMGGFKVTNAADGVDDGDYLTVRQMANYIAAWSDLSRFFLKRDGTTAMAGDLNYGNNKGINLKDPDLNAPLDAVNVRSLQRVIAVSGASPVGSIIDYIGEVAPSADWLLCDGQVYAASAYPVLSAILPSAYRTGAKQGCIKARFPLLVAGAGPGDVSGGAVVTGDILPLFQNLGRGYASAPAVTVRNPDGSATTAVVQVTVSALVVDGATVVSGGEIVTAQVIAGGTGVLAGAYLEFSDTLSALPTGYFRTPDLRGRVTVGLGTESLTPGVVDPPALVTGSAYDATTRNMGDFGGAEKHKLSVSEMPAHTHPIGTSWDGYDRNWVRFGNGGDVPSIGEGPVKSVGGSQPHPNVQPFHVLNKIIKAK
jgi:microcystin-dependent protein